MQINADRKQDAGLRLFPVCLRPLCFPDFPDNFMLKKKIIETIARPEKREGISYQQSLPSQASKDDFRISAVERTSFMSSPFIWKNPKCS